MADELNPDHPVTHGMREQWHKLLAILLYKYRDVLPRDVVLTSDDIRAIEQFDPQACVVAHDKADGLHLRVVTRREGEYLAAEFGTVDA